MGICEQGSLLCFLYIFFFFVSVASEPICVLGQCRPWPVSPNIFFFFFSFRPVCLNILPFSASVPGQCATDIYSSFLLMSKTQYPFVLRGCDSSILYQRAWRRAPRLYIYIWPPFWPGARWRVAPLGTYTNYWPARAARLHRARTCTSVSSSSFTDSWLAALSPTSMLSS